MSDRVVAVVMVLYFVAAFGYFKETKYGLAVAYVAYGLANVGLIMASRGY